MEMYDDIINLKRPEPSYKHPRMSIYNRSAIFAPFAALTGYKEEIIETERITDSKIELSEDSIDRINNILINLKRDEEITIEYFVKDIKKSGGKYMTCKGKITKIDYIKKEIIMLNNIKIPIDNVINIK